MQDLLKESRGTLSRDQQRKNAALNQWVQRSKKESQRFSVAAQAGDRPKNPRQCTVIEHAKHFRHHIDREINHLTKRICSEEQWAPVIRMAKQLTPFAGVDSQAEVAAAVGIRVEAIAAHEEQIREIRRLHQRINSLRRELVAWDRRVLALGGDSRYEHNRLSTTKFMGVSALLLPEATTKKAGKSAAESKRDRDSEDSGSDSSANNDDESCTHNGPSSSTTAYNTPLLFIAPSSPGVMLSDQQRGVGARFEALLGALNDKVIEAQSRSVGAAGFGNFDALGDGEELMADVVPPTQEVIQRDIVALRKERIRKGLRLRET